MEKSKIFTNAELKKLNERINGSKEDSNGLFSGRIRPKIIEMLSQWFPQRKKLEKLVEKKKGD